MLRTIHNASHERPSGNALLFYLITLMVEEESELRVNLVGTQPEWDKYPSYFILMFMNHEVYVHLHKKSKNIYQLNFLVLFSPLPIFQFHTGSKMVYCSVSVLARVPSFSLFLQLSTFWLVIVLTGEQVNGWIKS